MAPCRIRIVANDPDSGGRTYSGVCAVGQAGGSPVLTAGERLPVQRTQPYFRKFATISKAGQDRVNQSVFLQS